MATRVEKVGRRFYFRNAPFAGKDVLKSAGCKWDPDERCWWTGAGTEEDALALAGRVETVMPTTPTEPKPFRHYKCKQCGAKPNARGWPRIYKNGVCSNCYQDARDDY